MKTSRLFAFFIVLFLLVGVCCFPAGAEVTASGTCGDNATWTFDASTSTLTISGTGAIADNTWGFWYDAEFKNKITLVVVENGITAIGCRAFNDLDSIKTVQLPNTLIRIEEEAFSLCDGLQNIQLPNSLQYIGKNAFLYCTGIKKLVLPNSVTECGPGAFSCCSGLTDITLSENMKKLPYDLFFNCSNLTSITIPAGVEEMESWGPGWGNALSIITFKGDAPQFAENAFNEITATVRYPADNASWTEAKRQNYAGNITWLPDGDVQLSGTFGRTVTMSWKLEKGTLTISGNGYMDGWNDGTDTPWYPYRGQIKKVVLSGNLENIYVGAFRNHTELTEIQWTNSITYVFDNVFKNCTSLKTVSMPDSVTGMGGEVFNGCTALTSVKLPAKLKELGEWLFSGCTSLKSVTVPATVKSLGQCVFQNGPEVVYFKGDFPTNLQKPAAYGAGSFSAFKGTVYYPANNSTWTAAKIKEQTDIYGDMVRFVASAELNANPPQASSGQNTGSTQKPTNQETPETTAPTVAVDATEAPTVGDTIPPTTTHTPDDTTSPTEDISTDTQEPKPGNSFPWGIVIGAAVVVLAGGGAGLWFWLKKRK